jgi:transposase
MKLSYEELEAKLGATEAKLAQTEAKLAQTEAKLARTENLLKQALDRILKLEELLNKNSKNSSKPPSSDQKPDSPPGQKKKRKPRAGRNRQPYPPERVNHQIECTRDRCPHCQATNLQQLPDTPFSWQQAELPDIEAIVTQYDCLKYKCISCHRRSIGSFPDGIPFSSFGPKLMAFVGYLTGRFHLSKREAMLLLKDLYGVELSEGSVINIEENMTNALEEVYEKIHRYVIEGCLPRYFDETSWRDSGKKHYVWVGATQLASCYRIDRRRSQEALTRFIGPHIQAPAITDRYNAYNILDGPRQYCLAHLIRDFHAYSERQGDDGEVGSRLENELRRICKTHSKWGKKEISKSQWASLLSHSKRRLREGLLDGIVFGSDELSGLCDRIDKDFERLWHFKTIEGMDPTNNMAERDLRKLVLWRKKSYGTRSLRGQRFVERITSVIETLKKNNRAPLKFLEEAMTAFYYKQPAPSIAPALGI